MLSYATVFLAAAAAVNAHSVHRRDHRLLAREVTKPATYYEPYLEPYKVYHTRYLALNCQDKHNTTFFDDCCHPMLSTETLEKNRKPYCTPDAAASSSASAAEPTSTVVPDDGTEDDCEDEDDEPVTSQIKVEKPTSTKAPEPAKTTSSKFTTKRSSTSTHASSSAKPASTESTGGGKFSVGTVHTGGIATFFTQNGVAGACGKVHKDSDLVAAMTSSFYGSFSKESSVCGRQIEITRVDDGRKVVVTAADGCPTCETDTSIDLSEGAFNKIATKEEGITKITWKFIS